MTGFGGRCGGTGSVAGVGAVAVDEEAGREGSGVGGLLSVSSGLKGVITGEIASCFTVRSTRPLATLTC